MSKFSEFLESCVHNSSYNITQLAKLSGVNRTHLQKILIGERFLNNEELFDRLLSNLHLSWEKEQELRRLYRIEQIGEKRYEQMLNVIEFFKGFQKPAQIAATPSYTLIRANSQGTFSIQGRNSILYYLQNALGNVKAIGKQDIFLLAQDSYPPLFEILASQLYGLHDIHLEHILYYQADDEADSNHFIQNMKLSRNILPLLLANIDYIPLAIYQGHLEHQLSQSLLPYLYVDDAIVINFNADITSAMISFDKGLIAFYRNLFLKQKKKAIALTHSYQNTDFFETYYNGMNQAHAKQYYLIYGPCLLKHMPIEAIFQHVHPEYQTNNEFLSGLHDYLVKIGQSLNSVNYFTKQGVLLFMENGRDFQIPSFLYEPTTLAERLYVLRKILKQNQEDNRADFLLKEEYFSFESILSISCYSPTNIIFYYGEDMDKSTFFFKENSLNHCIYDFLANLWDPEMVYSVEETNAFYEEVIQHYETLLESSNTDHKTRR